MKPSTKFGKMLEEDELRASVKIFRISMSPLPGSEGWLLPRNVVELDGKVYTEYVRPDIRIVRTPVLPSDPDYETIKALLQL